ncbi:MAG: hypothetical protein SFU53_13260 [Terrimicrobiaceae bacterium]|nr:hypothetical protein [Terrimicrobiaceae bacterium]
MAIRRQLGDFFKRGAVGWERVFLFLILPPLVLVTAGVVYFVTRPEPAVPPPSPTPTAKLPTTKLPPFEPAELLRHLEEAEALERQAQQDGEGWAASASAFEILVTRHPENDRAWGGLGRSWNALGRHEEAMAALDRAVARNILEWRHFAARGDARRALGDARGAVIDYADALRLRPGNHLLSNAMLLTALDSGDQVLFETRLGRLSNGSGEPAAGWVVGVAAREMRNGDFQAGRTLIEKARELLAPADLEVLLEDPVFSDRRGQEFLNIALASETAKATGN